MFDRLLYAAYSHLDLIISMLCGGVVFLLMHFIKRPIKSINWQHSKDRQTFYKRNLILIVIAEALGAALYVGATYIIDKRSWQLLSVLLAGAWAVAAYEIYDLLKLSWRWILLFIGLLLTSEILNYIWAFQNTNHHKFCYSIRIFGFILMLVGFGRQLFKRAKEDDDGA